MLQRSLLLRLPVSLRADTASYEQRNAGTVRVKSFSHLLNHKNFLTVTSYYQSMSNVGAMHSEAA